MRQKLLILVVFCGLSVSSFSQDATGLDKITNFPNRFFERSIAKHQNRSKPLSASEKSSRADWQAIVRLFPLIINFSKKTKLQLLWDFLSYGQVLREQALRFRV